ncbi:hypothetical protein WR25_24170 [Diploscapter pachys]|uniref:Uncharacterized protein n=1 Tax=Diploscapter pachys TaxID=2018661 RepID=A0A2A2LMA7_9BILA|nr:hypothetical protein WR25_24170 [Diploscapter pachys]
MCRILRSVYIRIRSCSTADVLVLVRTTRTVSTMLTSHWGSSMTNGLIPMLARPGARSVFGMRSVSGMRSVFGMRTVFGMGSVPGMRSMFGTRSVSGFSAVTDPRVLNFIGLN